MTVFQYKFLTPRTLPNTPEDGYRLHDMQSTKARKWLRWYGEENNVQVRSAESAEGEATIQVNGNNYRPDGVIYDSDGKVVKILEFLG
jgi:hypothetical protein